MKIKLYYTFIIVLCIMIQNNSMGQTYMCEGAIPSDTGYIPLSNNCTTPPWITNTFEYSKYIPDNNMPYKTLRLRLIFIHYSEQDPRNFQISNSEHIDFFNDFIDSLNNIYSNLIVTENEDCEYEIGYRALPSTNDLSNISSHSRIQFEIDEIIEIIDPYYWNSDNFSSCSDAFYQSRNNLFFGANNKINIIYNGSECRYQSVFNNDTICNNPDWVEIVACANVPSLINFNSKSSIMMGSFYTKYVAMNNGYLCDEYFPNCCPSCPVGWYNNPRLLAHELGHTLGLYDNSNHCYESIMNQGFGTPGTYLYDYQLAQMHRFLSISNIRNYVKETNSFHIPLYITENETWDFSMRLYQDIVVTSGNILSIDCEIILPDNGKIIVEDGGGLVINGNVVLNEENEIIVEDGGTLIISNDADLTINGRGKIEVKSGGYFCIDWQVGANITLTDFESVINLREGCYINSVNTNLFPTTICLFDPTTFNTNGDGRINADFSDDVYIQNETISENRYYTGKNIYIGKNVTPLIPQGDVLININSKVILNAGEKVHFDAGFKLEYGSTIDVPEK